jgi:antitoxin component of MazEF toxin-antitoxin module
LADIPPLRYNLFLRGIAMATMQFRLPIGAKRQVTIPRDCMKLLSLEEGGEILLEVEGDHATLHPMVSLPRRDLPDELRQKYLSRLGAKETDIPLSEYLDHIGYKRSEVASPRKKAAAAKNKRALVGEVSPRGARIEAR